MAEKNDAAVVFVCDQNHVRFPLFLIWQICHHNPDRKFDFVIYSPDEITLPAWAAQWQVQIHKAGPLPALPASAHFAGSAITLYRFGMVRALADRYRRILYMDADMFVEGGDLNRLLAMDMSGLPIGGALDINFLRKPGHPTAEYRKVGLPALPYMNAGFQLIDTRAYLDQEVERRAFDAIDKYPDAITLSDQSALNLALKGKFVQLSPCWNWQANIILPLVTLRFPVFVRHFSANQKPDRNATGRIDSRFNLQYREFFARHDPEFLAKIVDPFDPAPMPLRDVARLVWKHVQYKEQAAKLIARHPDPYRPLLPQMKT